MMQQDFSKCPFDQATLLETGECPTCHREWEVKIIAGEKHMMSKPRKVRITGPIEPGAKYDDVIKPVKEDKSPSKKT